MREREAPAAKWLATPTSFAHPVPLSHRCVNSHSTTPQASSELDETRWFAREVQPHEPALRAYLRRRFPSLSDVDDVVQDSLLKAFLARRLGKLTAARGFLFHVARNSVISLFRRRKFTSPEPVNETAGLRVLQDDADVVESVCCADEVELVAEAIADLPARCREVVALRLLRGMDTTAIARELGISEATVRVQVARGMRKCTDFLRARGIINTELS